MLFACSNAAKLASITIATAAAATLALASAGIAIADATDDAFMHRLFADGLAFAPAEKAVPRARLVCQAFDAGMPTGSVHAKVLSESAFTARQAAIFMADAVSAYCPKYASQFIS
jgi:hypothetical protein